MHSLVTNTENPAEQHGGNIAALRSRFPDAPGRWLDLSTSVNPYPYPLAPAQPEWLQRLPDMQEVWEAQCAAADYAGVADASLVTLSAGMQPLFFALACLRMRERGASHVALFSPTYGEYAPIWRGCGHRVVEVNTLAELPEEGVAMLCNPNNPDARFHEPAWLLDYARRLAKKGGWLIVDESFADLAPEHSVASYVREDGNIAVLRASGKFFGLAGMRASWALAPRAWCEWMWLCSGPWPVPTQACHALIRMLRDDAWASSMRAQLAEEARQWRALLADYGCIIGHTPLFTLLETQQAQEIYLRLAARGIAVRRFAQYPHWLRFGLPAFSRRARVVQALSEHDI